MKNNFRGWEMNDVFSIEIWTEQRPLQKIYCFNFPVDWSKWYTKIWKSTQPNINRIKRNSEYFHCSHSFLCGCVSLSPWDVFFNTYILFCIFFHHSYCSSYFLFYLGFFFNFYDSEIIFVDVSQFPTERESASERLISSGIVAWKDRMKEKGQIYITQTY